MKFRPIKYLFTLIALSTLTLGVLPAGASGQAVRGRRAMVASQHEIASRIGVEIMKKGGNAVDAAIAVGIALAVVYPEAGNIGGGGFMLIRKANGDTHAIDYREMAPKGATRNMFLSREGQMISGEGSSTVGYRAAGVPGTLAGFELAFKEHGSGKVKWADLVRPARVVAEKGFILSHRQAELFRASRDSLSRYEDSNRIFLGGGQLLGEGDTLRQPDLGRTLTRVEIGGAREFYTGTTARMIADDMRGNGGLMTLDDLKNYEAKERTPVRGTYRGHEIISMPLPSSGGVVMLNVLNILEGYDVRGLEFGSAAKLHLMTEAMRRAFADRAEYMGDPDHADIPAAALIDKKYAEQRRSTIDLKKATPSLEIRYGSVVSRESMDTTHFTVVDAAGTIVSNTYTINDLFGSQVTVKGTGVLLNNEMDDFAANPGTANMFGLIQGERNSVQPGKRPLSSMTPTIVLKKDGSTWFALGARGGPRIISAVLQTVINVIDHDMDLDKAIAAPRIHHQWFPDEIVYEPNGLSPDTRMLLDKMGHMFIPAPITIASATGIIIDDKGVRLGVIDPRSDGLAVGY